MPLATFAAVLILGTQAVTGAGASTAAAAAPSPVIIYVSPHGRDASTGTTPGHPVATLGKAQQLVRSIDADMTSDIDVQLASGPYRLSQPLTLGAQDSGSNGYNVVWTAAPGADPVLSGGKQITGWQPAGSGGIWSAPAPAGLTTRQLYVDGVRADAASGPLPVMLTPTSTGYTASSTAMDDWRNPSQIEFVYTGGEGYWSLNTGGLGAWTEPRCPIASISGTTITMAEPCWDNSTERVEYPGSTRTVNLVGPNTLGNGEIPAYLSNAYELLSKPGQWYLDSAGHTIYYIPRPGQDLRHADVEAPVLQTLVSGQDVHNVAFRGIGFSYATWLQPSSTDGLSEIQANYTITGPDGFATQGLCQFVSGGTCPYGNWPQEPGNVDFSADQDVRFTGDTFTHLGAAGLRLGDGSQNDTVQGDVFTDISGNGLELGGVDDPAPAAAAQDTTGNQILDNHFYALPVEYHGGTGIDVGYAEHTLISHNQIDNTAYTAISIGWGGWPDKIDKPATPNYSNGNVISDNLIENPMQELADGGAIYTQGITGSSLADGEQVTGNVILGALDHGHAIYTDNGSTFITASGNVEFGNENDWGSRHTDYTAGATGDDPLLIENNYWQQGDQDNSSGNVTESGNHIISSLSQAPAAILDDAGLQPGYRGLAGENAAGAAASVPEAPDQVAAFAAAGTGYVSWNPAFVANGAPVLAYRVTASPAGASDTASTTISAADYDRLAYAVVRGLTNGTSYTFSVQAINRLGASAASLPTGPVTVAASDGAVPSAPASVSVEPGDGTVSVHITAPSSAGGTPVTGYTISAPGTPAVQFTGHHVLWGATGSNSIFTTVGGLKSLVPYTFSVAAVNAAGPGPARAAQTVILGTTAACSGAKLTVSPPAAVAQPGQTVQVTQTLTDGCPAALSGVQLYLQAPSGYTITPSSPVPAGDVAAGGSVSKTWTVTVPASASGSADLFDAAVFTAAGSSGYQETQTTSAVSVPYASFGAAFDDTGITDDTATTAGNIDGAGYSFSAPALATAGATPGGTVTAGGLAFTWPSAAAGTPDNVVASGQAFKISGSGSQLGFLLTGTYVSAANGAASGTGQVVYTDGTSSSFSLNAPDWHGGCSAAGTGVALYTPYRNGPSGKSTLPVCVYAASAALTAGKTISYVVLPDVSASTPRSDVPSMHLFAVVVK